DLDATDVAALVYYQAACDSLAGTHVDGVQVRVTGAQAICVIDDDGVAKAGIDRVGARQLHRAAGRSPNVLVVERQIPAVVPVIADVVAPPARLRIALAQLRLAAVPRDSQQAIRR